MSGRSALDALQPVCSWCAKPTPLDPLAVIRGIAIGDDEGEYEVRGMSARGPESTFMVWTASGLDNEAAASSEAGRPVALIGGDEAWLICDPVEHPVDLLGDLRDALAAARAAQDAAMTAAMVGVKYAVAHGVSEADAARRVGVDRMTVRKWLGK